VGTIQRNYNMLLPVEIRQSCLSFTVFFRVEAGGGDCKILLPGFVAARVLGSVRPCFFSTITKTINSVVDKNKFHRNDITEVLYVQITKKRQLLRYQ
jgi:hypothetical protein